LEFAFYAGAGVKLEFYPELISVQEQTKIFQWTSEISVVIFIVVISNWFRRVFWPKLAAVSHVTMLWH